MIAIAQFKKSYSKAIREGYAAIFAGAGLSKGKRQIIPRLANNRL